MSTHLCLSCRYAAWQRRENGRLTGIGFCEVPDPELPDLPATKWWSKMVGTKSNVRGGELFRRPEKPVKQCSYYHPRDSRSNDRAKP